jgi:hypothetical protein
MKTLAAFAFLIASLLASPATAADDDAVAQAQGGAKQWLALVDHGQYPQSWEEAASVFQAAVAKPTWVATVKAVRSPLGALKSRQLKSATFTRTLPGAPSGDYVVIQYDTDFENKAAAIETVTPMRDKDGRWRVSGYYIR